MATYNMIYGQIDAQTKMEIGLHQPVGTQRPDCLTPDACSFFNDGTGALSQQVGLTFAVGGRGYKMAVSLEPDDTYTVRLLQTTTRRGVPFCTVKAQRAMVTTDVLNQVIRFLYGKFGPR